MKPDQRQCKDTGLAIVLVLLLAAYFTGARHWIPPAIIALVLSMTWPGLFAGPARLWFGFAHALGTVASKVVLAVLFYFLVTPVGILRRALGKDPMQRKGWASARGSSFILCDRLFDKADLEKPY
jgi:hypothetical protein